MTAASADRAAYLNATEAIAAPSWRNEARRLADNGVEFIVERYGIDGRSTFVPVRYAVVSFSPDSATVAVWGVTLASGSSARGIDESWVTGTIELAWIDDGWRVAEGSSSVGPTPRLLQAGEPAPASELEVFEEYSGVPEP